MRENKDEIPPKVSRSDRITLIRQLQADAFSARGKAGERQTRKPEPAELKLLRERAAALAAAIAIMLALLFSTVLDPGLVGLTVLVGGVRREPSASPPQATPRPTADPTLVIRLADVDRDVSPEVVIKLVGIEPESGGVELKGDEPTVLIYHTHDTEAYRQTPDSTYAPSGNCRTEDDGHNVYAVGEELKRLLWEEYGIRALHASEKHEKPLITSAYSRSLETMRRYKEEYPSLEMFIDLHRDGVADTGWEDDFVTVDGLECARMMFVVGTGKSGKSSQFAPSEAPDTEHDMPDFESNYALAVRLTETLLSYDPDFMRNIRVKSGKYNQQVSDKCLLVEVGHNGNTLEQAENSMRFLAKAIASLGLPEQ